MAATKAVKRPHWYRIEYNECVLCGGGPTYRERIYGKRPKDPRKRIFYRQFAHESHFL
jgi:hypothetical protein